MKTISQIVQKIISQSPFLSEALSEDIANESKVARKIKSQVEKERMEKVSEAAILAALRRMKIKPMKALGVKMAKNLSNITVRSDLVEFIFYNPPDLLRVHQEILKEVERNKDDIFLNIARGNYESLVIISRKFENSIEKILGKQKIIRKVKNLSYITLRLPDAMFTSGVYFPFLKVLAWEGISFVEIISIANELTFLFEDKDIDRAFAAIKSLASARS